MKRQEILELEAQMRLIARRLRRVVGERAASMDPPLNRTAYVVLEHLHRHDRSRQKDIVDALGWEKGAVSRAIRDLGELGFVETVPDPDDGRAQRVAITDLGAERLDEVIQARRAAYAEKLRGWTTAEIRQLVDDLARYNAALDDD